MEINYKDEAQLPAPAVELRYGNRLVGFDAQGLLIEDQDSGPAEVRVGVLAIGYRRRQLKFFEQEFNRRLTELEAHIVMQRRR